MSDPLALLVDEVVERLAERLRPLLTTVPAESVEPWRLVGVDEVAAALGRSKRWVHGSVKDRGLPFIRLDGGALAFELEDVRAWARDRRVPAGGDDPLASRLHPSGKSASRAASNGRSRTAMQRVSR